MIPQMQVGGVSPAVCAGDLGHEQVGVANLQASRGHSHDRALWYWRYGIAATDIVIMGMPIVVSDLLLVGGTVFGGEAARILPADVRLRIRITGPDEAPPVPR